jgi:hypothetical protein
MGRVKPTSACKHSAHLLISKVVRCGPPLAAAVVNVDQRLRHGLPRPHKAITRAVCILAHQVLRGAFARRLVFLHDWAAIACTVEGET